MVDMSCKEGQFDVVEVNVFEYLFECYACKWNDSLGFGFTYTDIRLLDTLEFKILHY